MELDPYSDELMNQKVRDQHFAFIRLMGKMESHKSKRPQKDSTLSQSHSTPCLTNEVSTTVPNRSLDPVSTLIDTQIQNHSWSAQQSPYSSLDKTTFKQSFDQKRLSIEHQLRLKSEVEKSYGTADVASHLYDMDNRIACLNPETKQKEMLQRHYKLKKNCLTDPKHLMKAIAAEPLMFFLYKRRDFDSHKIKNAPMQDLEQSQQKKHHTLETAFTDELIARRARFKVNLNLSAEIIEAQEQENNRRALKKFEKLTQGILDQIREIRDCHMKVERSKPKVFNQSSLTLKTNGMIDSFVTQAVDSLNDSQIYDLIRYLIETTVEHLQCDKNKRLSQHRNSHQSRLHTSSSAQRSPSKSMLENHPHAQHQQYHPYFTPASSMNPNFSHYQNAPSIQTSKSQFRSILLLNQTSQQSLQRSCKTRSSLRHQLSTLSTPQQSFDSLKHRNRSQLSKIRSNCQKAQTLDQSLFDGMRQTTKGFHSLEQVQTTLETVIHYGESTVPEYFDFQSKINTETRDYQRDEVRAYKTHAERNTDGVKALKWYKIQIEQDRAKLKNGLKNMRKQCHFVQNLH